ncbi:SDR family NAD(P)-dependent oxidoreductase [Aeromicrobium sp. Sec7.5]|uniref:SDR family NAD(P)-dependent oxidoreductase n=1 Tax=Aeromicrobium sp. Sec7.5 TaxID=3121276 RepID=UPI002FE46397
MSSSVWWITGASRGLGRALAEVVAARGDVAVATGRVLADLPSGAGIVPMALDVTDVAAVRATGEQIMREHGRLDVVVNNAGYGFVGAVEESTDGDLLRILDSNLLGAARVARAALPHLRATGSGRLIFVSTVGAVGTMPLLGLYNASKWALEGLAEALAGEVAEHGVRVSIVEPGGIDTAWGTGSMQFAHPLAVYDGLRERQFGTAAVPWAAEGTGGGTAPADVAVAIVEHATDPADERLRVLLGDDAPAMVAAALQARLDDYRRDPRFADAERSGQGA